jgi:ADP-dependent NAD(P)H-hydrate dehydratase / NAD(P)H-hydrate epimerase
MQNDFDYAGLLNQDLKEPVTVEGMKMIEDIGEKLGVSKLTMMENAGSRIAHFIFQNLSQFDSNRSHGKTKVLFVAGTGNNGGDTFVAARHLVYWKDACDVTVAIIGKAEEIRAEEARVNYKVLEGIPNVRTIQIGSEELIDSFVGLLELSKIIVVGIFGTGFRGEPRPLQGRIIRLINERSGMVKISVDVPSGLEAESGNFKLAVRSDYTIAMHAPKVGMERTQAARELCGRILVANIGVPL